MGYDTYFSGVIQFGKGITDAQLLAIEERLNAMDVTHVVSMVRGENIDSDSYIQVDGEWRNYWGLKARFDGFDNEEDDDSSNTMWGVLKRIAVFFDDDAFGEIEASGDDKEDVWRVMVKGKNLVFEQGEVRYVKADSWSPSVEQVEASDLVRAEVLAKHRAMERDVARIVKETKEAKKEKMRKSEVKSC